MSQAPKGEAHARALARLGAVQALYQMDVAGSDIADVLAQFEADRLGRDGDGNRIGNADLRFFKDLVAGVLREQARIDPDIDAHLAKGWRLNRLDSTLRAILRGGAYELHGRPDVPARVVIDQYVQLAHAFFEGEESKVVNAVLDRIARETRAAELAK